MINPTEDNLPKRACIIYRKYRIFSNISSRTLSITAKLQHSHHSSARELAYISILRETPSAPVSSTSSQSRRSSRQLRTPSRWFGGGCGRRLPAALRSARRAPARPARAAEGELQPRSCSPESNRALRWPLLATRLYPASQPARGIPFFSEIQVPLVMI